VGFMWEGVVVGRAVGGLVRQQEPRPSVVYQREVGRGLGIPHWCKEIGPLDEGSAFGNTVGAPEVPVLSAGFRPLWPRPDAPSTPFARQVTASHAPLL